MVIAEAYLVDISREQLKRSKLKFEIKFTINN